MAKLKTLEDIEKQETHGTNNPEGGRCSGEPDWWAEGFKENIFFDIKQEQIKWIKDAQKSWVTGSHTDNSHFVLDMWMKSLDITDE